ncbi:MAG: 2-dehydro-3-deoxy-6-phosphogalactonate aldolase [Gammaproteobacteria bacterium]|nr:2-dehydro-3-deoxy-6-phosphogalactonate aldolase [Gammaproteobacteria bacterium]
MTILEKTWAAALEKMPLVAILRGIQPEEALDVANVLIDQGFTIIEVPLNSPKPFKTLKMMSRNLGDRAMIGAGTVLCEEDVDTCVEAGCELIIAPNLDPDVAAACARHKVIYCPGVATPTEAFAAIKSGAHAIKLFPAESITPSIVRALRAVIPSSVTMLPVGGISPDNLGDFYNAGATGFGIGSALYKSGKPIEEIESAAKAFVAALHLAQQTTP